nr:reverse transcriptase domain-containing protein [Tanacetum cinerariifolium]
TTNLKNDITNIQQRFDETFSEAYDRFKDLLHKCPHHALVKAIEEICVTYGGPRPYYECLATDGNTFNASAATWTYNQGGPGYRPRGDTNYRASNQIRPPSFPQLNVHNYQNRPTGSESLPSNTIANPRGDLKVITTRSGVSYDGPTIPPTSFPLPKEVEREPEATKDKVQTISSRSIAQVQPLVVQVPIPEPNVAPKPNHKLSIPYPSRINDQKLREKANNQMLKFFQIFQKLHFDLSFVDALLHMPKIASIFKSLHSNKEKLFELANTPLNENCSAVLLKKLLEKLGNPGKFLILCDFSELEECLALTDLGASIKLIPLSVWKKLSLLELTPTRMTLEFANRSVAYLVGVAEDVFVKVGKFHFSADFVVVDYDVDPKVSPHSREAFLENGTNINRFNRIEVIDVTCEAYAQEGGDFILEEIKACLTKDSIPPGIDDADFDLEGDILLLEKLLNDDPSSPLPPKELHLSRTYLLILIQHQRRVNPKMHEVIKKEVIKLLDAGLIYPISDSPWVSPIHRVPKKGGMTVVTNKANELIRIILVTGWPVCIDYQKLNDATSKDHFSLPFMD